MAEPLKSAAELVADIRGETADPESKPDTNPKAQKTYTFQFEHIESGTGKVRKGSFTNHVLTLGQRRQVGVIQAQLSGGVPWGSLSPFDRDLIMTLAHLTVSLDPVKRPKWAQNLEGLYDQAILDKLYEEVAAHEATFHGRAQDQAEVPGHRGADVPDGGADDLAPKEAPSE